MFWIVVIVIFVFIALRVPLWLSVIFFVINFYIPDPIPFIDEFIQGYDIASRLKMVGNYFSRSE